MCACVYLSEHLHHTYLWIMGGSHFVFHYFGLVCFFLPFYNMRQAELPVFGMLCSACLTNFYNPLYKRQIEYSAFQCFMQLSGLPAFLLFFYFFNSFLLFSTFLTAFYFFLHFSKKLLLFLLFVNRVHKKVKV